VRQSKQEPFLHMWRRVLEEGREVELGGEALPAPPESASDQAAPALGRVIALPIEVRNRTCGVLMAGLLPLHDSTDDLARLECYALLASSALDQEATRGERTGWMHFSRQIVEESTEYLVFVDEEGRVAKPAMPRETFLRLGSGHEKGTVIRGSLRSGLARGGNRMARACRSKRLRHGRNPERPVVPLEATLTSGGVVRLHLRSTVEACGNADRRWLVYFEDYGSRMTQLEEEGRLEAEFVASPTRSTPAWCCWTRRKYPGGQRPLCPNHGTGNARPGRPGFD